MKATKTQLALFGAAGIVGAVVVQLAWPHIFGSRTVSSEQLASAADSLNHQLPMMMGETEVVHAAGFDHVFEYQYRLVNVVAALADTAAMRAGLTPRLRNNACTSATTRPTFLEHGVTMRYTYADRDRRPLLSIDVTLRDCGS